MPGRYPSLDGLRGIAVLLVVAHNLMPIRDPTDVPTHLLIALFDRGWIGVQLFFVLSGFLITGILLDEPRSRKAWRRFFVRRALRIFPLYYALLFVMLVLLPALGWLPADFRRTPSLEIYLWTYLWNWVAPFHPHAASFPHVWSLAVEEQFYLLWPLIALGRPPRQVLAWCAALAVGGLAARIALVAAQASPEMAYQFTVCRIDALALGGAMAAALRMPQLHARLAALRTHGLGAAAAVLVLGALASGAYRIFTPAGQTVGYSSLAVAFAWLVLWCATSDDAQDDAAVSQLLRSAGLRRVGLYSYGMYLLHVPLHQLVGMPLMARWGLATAPSASASLAYMVAGTAVSLAAAAASYHAFERYFLELKGRWATAAAQRSKAV